MPYPPEHRTETGAAKILDSARRLFNRNGSYRNLDRQNHGGRGPHPRRLLQIFCQQRKSFTPKPSAIL